MNMTTRVPAGSVAGEREVAPYEPTLPNAPVVDPETAADAVGPSDKWRFWNGQITAALAGERIFRAEAEAVERLAYGPEPDSSVVDRTGQNLAPISDETSLIHANLEVLKPLVFSETPQVIVRRRWYGDGGADEAALMAAEAAQRLATYLLDTEDFDGAVMAARDDWLIAGRGVARVMYKATFGPGPVDPATGAAAEVKTDERVCPRHAEWARVLFPTGYAWDALPWLAFEVPMTRTQVTRRFGAEIANRVNYNDKGLVGSLRPSSDDQNRAEPFMGKLDQSGKPVDGPFDTCSIWEIWDRENGENVWWTASYTLDTLDAEPDILALEQFYPIPKPLLATTKGQRLTPRPDVRYYQRNAKEIEKATKKLNELLEVLAVAGVVPAGQADMFQQLFKGKNQIIAIADWVALKEKGGLNGLIEWLPIDVIVKAMQALMQMREANRQAMFEASGISDIMRAQGDPNETATAQQIKGRYAGLRLADRQRRMAIFARDLIRLMIELAVEHFDTARIAEICGGLGLPLTEAERMAEIARREAMMQVYQAQVAAHGAATQAAQMAQQQNMPPQIDPGQPPEEPKFDKPVPSTSWEVVHARLRSDLKRKITIQIETQSTILADETEDKQLRVEFLSAFSQFVGELMPLVGTGSFQLKTVKELLLFGIRGFPKARTLEMMITQIPDEMPPTQPPVDPAVQVARIKAEVDLQIEQMKEAHDMRMKGVEVLQDAAERAAPTPQKPDLSPEPKISAKA